MSDEDALLAAIDANPDEDTPRLVYADWLDEHDQPIRAEFIRVQVEVVRVETQERIVLDQHIDLFRRQHHLLENHRAELLGRLSVLPKETLFEFERGFVSEITLDWGPFHQHRAVIAAAVPLPRTIVQDTAARVRTMLGFGRPATTLEDDAYLVAAIGTIPERTFEERSLARIGPALESLPFHSFSWPRLTGLDVSGCRLGDENATALFRPDSFPILADLDLSANHLTDAAVSALLDSGLAPQLKRLVLGGNPINDEGAIELGPALADG